MRSVLPLLLTILLCLWLAGCGAGTRQAAAPLPPDRYSLPAVTTYKAQPSAGTIFHGETSANLYADKRAGKVGDILLVKIVETSNGSKKASTKTERDSSVTGDVSALFGFEKWLGNHNQNFTPSSSALQLGLQNDFEGQGETKRSSTVTATLSARVIDITVDGNLVIRGFREVRVNNETQYIILSGLVRPEDVSPDNSVLSSYVADARIDYTGSGALSDKQQPGWLARGLDVLWPF